MPGERERCAGYVNVSATGPLAVENRRQEVVHRRPSVGAAARGGERLGAIEGVAMKQAGTREPVDIEVEMGELRGAEKARKRQSAFLPVLGWL